jgi:hypothetical protein
MTKYILATFLAIFFITLAIHYYPRPTVPPIRPPMIEEEFCELAEQRQKGYCVVM